MLLLDANERASDALADHHAHQYPGLPATALLLLRLWLQDAAGIDGLCGWPAQPDTRAGHCQQVKSQSLEF